MNNTLQRGYAAIQARNLPEAVRCFEEALHDDPDNAQALAWLGQALCSLGRRVEGHARLRQCGRIQIRNAEASRDIRHALEIAQLMQQWVDFEGALELLTRAVEINGTEFRGQQLLAVTLAQLNRKNEALEAGRRALALAPDLAMMQVLMASLEADAGLNAEARQRLETILAGQPGDREAFRAHKEMARVLDKLKMYDQVFSHLHASGRLAARLPEYSQQDRNLLPNAIRANTAGFDRELMGRWSDSEFPEGLPPPIFVIGFFRSGTTLTQEVLGVHPEIFVADETGFISAMQRELQRMDPASASDAERLRKLDLQGILRLRAFYWKTVRDRFGDEIGQRRLVDKHTMNTVDVGLINTVFPDARLLFVMRDPRDVCISCFMQLMVPSPATAHLQTLQDTAAFYAQVMDWWTHVKPLLTMDCLEFRYEDAVAEFEPTFRGVFDFLGLSWDPEAVNFHKYAARKHVASPSRNQVAQPLYASSLARWRRYAGELSSVAETLAPCVRRFGYEAD
jgi:hypothetical protein